MSGAYLIIVAAAGISALLFLVIKVRLHAFVTLLLVSLLVGVAAGMPLDGVIKSIEKGMGGTLGFVAVVVGLGAMFGQMLEVSGGAERLARTMVRRFGDDKVQWALGLTGFIVSIPVFLDVAGTQTIIPNDDVIICAGGVLPSAFLAGLGIRMERHFGGDRPIELLFEAAA